MITDMRSYKIHKLNPIDISFSELDLDDKLNLTDFNDIHEIKPIFINKKYDVIDKILFNNKMAQNSSLTLTIDYFIRLIAESRLNEIEYILENDKYNLYYVNLRDSEGDSLLHFSVFSDNFEITNILLKYGADPNIFDKEGQTPLFRAIFCRNIEIIGLLFAFNADINMTDKMGNTVLHIAVLVKNYNIIIELLKFGADPEIKNRDGFKPTDYAFIKKEGKIVVDEFIIDLIDKHKK